MADNVREAFNLPIPSMAIVMGFPSKRSRGKTTSRSVGEILVQEWKGDGIEKALVSIHPERFRDAEQVALSLMLLVGDEVYGSRRHSGALALGVQLNRENGKLEYTQDDKGAHARTALGEIIRKAGTMPVGHAELPEPVAVQRTRMRLYECSECHQKIRAGSDTLEMAHLTDGGKFQLQLPKSQQTPVVATTAPVTSAISARTGKPKRQYTKRVVATQPPVEAPVTAAPARTSQPTAPRVFGIAA